MVLPRACAAAMPPLAGAPLCPPRLLETGWEEEQEFSAADDPDRVREPWAAPAFGRCGTTACTELPVTRRACTFARVVQGVLTEAQCAQLLECVNQKGFTPALVNIGGGRQLLERSYRDGHRCIVDCPELAAWLFAALREHLPQELDGKRLVGLNERLRFLCYLPGQQFSPHHDATFARVVRGQREASRVTVQLYLHDVPAAHGGATTFHLGRERLPCQPGAGSCLLFSQDLLHEGSLVTKGIKYTVRTEAMYVA